MPELPEVETVRRGIAPHLVGEVIDRMVIRQRQLRWPISRTLPGAATNQRVHAVDRRAKYLLIELDDGHLIWHLGMSGSFRVLKDPPPPGTHDHVDVCLKKGATLRFRDPRRFGSLHWTRADPLRHRLLRNLGPEPLGEEFSGEWLYARSRGRSGAVKNFLMDSKIVVGLGNIYASEALFEAGISPIRAAGRVGLNRYRRLAEAARAVLTQAIKAGGDDVEGFYESGRGTGLFCAGTPGIRTGRRGMPPVRGAGALPGNRATLKFLLPAMSAVTRVPPAQAENEMPARHEADKNSGKECREIRSAGLPPYAIFPVEPAFLWAA